MQYVDIDVRFWIKLLEDMDPEDIAALKVRINASAVNIDLINVSVDRFVVADMCTLAARQWEVDAAKDAALKHAKGVIELREDIEQLRRANHIYQKENEDLKKANRLFFRALVFVTCIGLVLLTAWALSIEELRTK